MKSLQNTLQVENLPMFCGFDVDENGFTKNMKILESSNKNFKEVSISALS